jgi:hypothetical protein
MRAITILILTATTAAAQWELVINQPAQTNVAGTNAVAITSLCGKAIRTSTGGTVWTLGTEGPARDAYNRLAARNAVPTQYPALVHESGCILQPADAQAIVEREARLAAWQDERGPIVYDRPIQAAIETPAVDGHVYGLEVNPATGAIVPVQRESDRKTQEQYEAERAARFADDDSIIALLRALRPVMTNAIAGAKESKTKWEANRTAWQAITNTVWTDTQQRREAGKMKAAGIAAANAGVDAANASIDTARALNKFRVRLLKFYKVEEAEVE